MASDVKNWVLDQESFDSLLDWLDADRARAGRKYEEIRVKLIRIIARRGCQCPEEIADEAINRVTRKVSELRGSYVGDPANYFCGVAQNVYLEYSKKQSNLLPLPQMPLPAPAPHADEEQEQEHACLEECLRRLSKENNELILRYYDDEKKARIDHRRDLATHLGITTYALRMRVFRIKTILQSCIFDCMKRSVTN